MKVVAIPRPPLLMDLPGGNYKPNLMNRVSYDKQLEDIVRYWSQCDLFDNAEVHRNFSFCCANLRHFRPSTLGSDMSHIFREITARQILAALDVHHVALDESVRITGWDQTWVDPLRRAPGIICTYHTGSYRLICRLLAASGISAALLLSADVLKKQGPDFLEIYRQAAGAHAGVQLDLIDAERPTSLMAMARAARAGLPILAYIDGNAGAGAASRSNNLAEICFLAGRMPVRRGITRFASYAKLPIYPVRCTRPAWRHIHLEFPPPISENEINKPANIERLYAPLIQLVDRTPHEWEGWLYRHTPAISGLRENHQKHHADALLDELFPFTVNGRTYAVYGQTLSSIAVDKPVYNALLQRQRKANGFG